jgi:hypothetical protein
MVRKASVRPRGRPGYVESPEDLHGLSYYIRRAEDLLAGLTDAKESLTLEDRVMLDRHLARAREIAPKPEPLTISEKRAISCRHQLSALARRDPVLVHIRKGFSGAEYSFTRTLKLAIQTMGPKICSDIKATALSITCEDQNEGNNEGNEAQDRQNPSPPTCLHIRFLLSWRWGA